MAGIVVKGFQGMQPTVDPKLLPDSAAQVAENTRLTSGTVRPWKEPGDKKTLTLRSGETTVKTIYRYGQGEKAADGSVSEDKYWLHFANERNIVKAPTYSTKERTYYTGATGTQEQVYVNVTESDIAGTTGSLPAFSYRVGLPRPATTLSVVEEAPEPVTATYAYNSTTNEVTITTSSPHGYDVGTKTYVYLDASYGALAGDRYVYVKSSTEFVYTPPSLQVASAYSEETPGVAIYIYVTLYEAHQLALNTTVVGSLVGATETPYKLTNKSFVVTGEKALRYEVEDNTITGSPSVASSYLTFSTPVGGFSAGEKFKIGYNGGTGFAQYNGRYDAEVVSSSASGPSSIKFPVTGDAIESITVDKSSRFWAANITLSTEHFVPIGEMFNVNLVDVQPAFLSAKTLRATSTGLKTLRIDYPTWSVTAINKINTYYGDPYPGAPVEFVLDGSTGYSLDLASPHEAIFQSTVPTYSPSLVRFVPFSSTKIWVGYGTDAQYNPQADPGIVAAYEIAKDVYGSGTFVTVPNIVETPARDSSTLPGIAATMKVSFAAEPIIGATSKAVIVKTSLPTSSTAYWHMVPPLKATGGLVATLGFPDGTQDVIVTASLKGTPETRYYVWTYVNGWGEEGPPSMPSNSVEIRPQFKAAISGTATTTPTLYNISKARIYRTATGSQATDYQFVHELTAGSSVTVSHVDDKRQSLLGEVLPTTTWDMPPPILAYNANGTVNADNSEKAEQKLLGLSSMANGILAGYFDNTLCFSEPFQPYAWPLEYRKTLDFPITGMGAFGSSLFVGTTANPYIISGIDPAVMSMTKIETKQACVSPRSVVEMGGGVIYASPDGLCLADGTGVVVITSKIIQRDDWQFYKPESIHAAQLDGRYFAFFNNGTTSGCLILDLSGTGATLWTSTIYCLAAYQDPQRDALYLVQNVDGGYKVRAWDGGTTSLTYKWRSKKFQLEKPTNLGAAQVLAKAYPVTFKLYVDGTLKHTQTVASTDPFRLPSGYIARDYEFELTGTNEVTSVFITNSMEELKRV